MRALIFRLRQQLRPVAFESEGSSDATTTMNLNDIDLDHREPNGRAKAATAQIQAQSDPTHSTPAQGTASNDELVQKDAQPGVQRMEATTQVWSRNHLIAAYVM